MTTDARYYLDVDMGEPGVTPWCRGVAAVISRPCPGKLSPNEDAAALVAWDDDCGVLVVADGMGGGRAGEQASRLAVEAVASAVASAAASDVQLRTAILNGIEQANQAVKDLAIGAATTLAAVEISAGEARPYHVGDSLVLVLGGRGKIKLQTTAHSPVGFGVEAGLLDESEAMHHEDRHLVSNMVGTDSMRIELGAPLRLAANDTVLLATDGLSDNLHVEEIVEMARKGSLEQAASRLAATAAERMHQATDGLPSKPDDLTLLLFRRQAKSASP